MNIYLHSYISFDCEKYFGVFFDDQKFFSARLDRFIIYNFIYEYLL